MFACASVILLHSCSDEVGDDGIRSDRYRRTVIVYMSAENSLAQFLADDSLEIARSLPDIADSVRVVLFIDDVKGSRVCAGSSNRPMRLERTYERDICSTDSADMQEVLADIVRTYPSCSYGLVLWSHASGWIFPRNTEASAVRRRSFGIDNGHRTTSNSGREMSIPTLAHVLATLPHFDFILFDACFMQCVEVAYELRHVCDYVLGSPAEIPGTGAPYETLMPALCQPVFSPDAALDAYHSYYDSEQAYSEYRGVELSAVRTASMPALANATRPLVTSLFADRSAPDCTQVQKYRAGSSYSSYPEFYDLRHLLYLNASQEEFAAWDAVYQAAVTTRLSEVWFSAYPYGHYEQMADTAHSGALSLFVPMDKYVANGWAAAYRGLEWYAVSGLARTGW